jgi:hypothetical protein
VYRDIYATMRKNATQPEGTFLGSNGKTATDSGVVLTHTPFAGTGFSG